MHIFKKLSLAVAGFGLLFALSAVVPVSAQAPATSPATQNAKNSVCEGVGIATGTNCDDKKAAEGSINKTIGLVINMLGFIVGIIAVIMIIIGGLKYIMSSGDASNITSAKNTILYAVIGLVVVALSQVIVRFVLNKASPI